MSRPCTVAFSGLLLLCASSLSSCERGARERYRPKPPPAETGPIALGEFGSMTGEDSARDLSAHAGIRLAIEDVNAQGGIGGRMLVLHTFDDQGRTEAAARAVERLESEDRSAVMIASSPSTIVAAAARNAKAVPIIALDGGAKAASAADFRERFRARFATEPDADASFAYGATRLVADALSRGKSFANVDVVEALARAERERTSMHDVCLRADPGSKLLLHAEPAKR